ncbi:hypothetical protein ABZY68_16645, partial [Streptomyces sp. NPDC006482]
MKDTEALLRDEPSPAPRTDRERALMYAVLYEIHDAHHRNQARVEETCDIVNRYGLAVFLRRCEAELSPVEALTAHYAATHAHPAWRHRLAPMDAVVLFRAVREDLRAQRRGQGSPSPSCPGCLPSTPRPRANSEAASSARRRRRGRGKSEAPLLLTGRRGGGQGSRSLSAGAVAPSSYAVVHECLPLLQRA